MAAPANRTPITSDYTSSDDDDDKDDEKQSQGDGLTGDTAGAAEAPRLTVATVNADEVTKAFSEFGGVIQGAKGIGSAGTAEAMAILRAMMGDYRKAVATFSSAMTSTVTSNAVSRYLAKRLVDLEAAMEIAEALEDRARGAASSAKRYVARSRTVYGGLPREQGARMMAALTEQIDRHLTAAKELTELRDGLTVYMERDTALELQTMDEMEAVAQSIESLNIGSMIEELQEAIATVTKLQRQLGAERPVVEGAAKAASGMARLFEEVQGAALGQIEEALQRRGASAGPVNHQRDPPRLQDDTRSVHSARSYPPIPAQRSRAPRRALREHPDDDLIANEGQRAMTKLMRKSRFLTPKTADIRRAVGPWLRSQERSAPPRTSINSDSVYWDAGSDGLVARGGRMIMFSLSERGPANRRKESIPTPTTYRYTG